MTNRTSNFQPNWVSPPGDSIEAALEEQNRTCADLAPVLQFSEEQLKELMTGCIRIDHSLASKLADEIGGTPEFWVRRDLDYLSECSRLGIKAGSGQRIPNAMATK